MRFESMQRQRGVGLIEVLVAVLILSIGILGIAALQARAVANNNSDMARSMATVASYSILDAMRADRANFLAGAYNNISVAANNCPTADSTSTFEQQQVSLWCNQLGETLGAVSTTTGTISCDASQLCAITISFDESRLGKGSGMTSVTTKVQL